MRQWKRMKCEYLYTLLYSGSRLMNGRYVPKTRSELGLEKESEGQSVDYDEILGDTPIYTLFMLIRQQVLAFPAYLLFNVSGQRNYPKWWVGSSSTRFTRLTTLCLQDKSL